MRKNENVCGICGIELNDSNRAERLEYGCKQCEKYYMSLSPKIIQKQKELSQLLSERQTARIYLDIDSLNINF